uniref:Secreted protein n=1 Tax=Trypanosoma vivax (strain Y486) TaxID=1055687 RepID=G0UCK4_TRYVY|nr:hypothetical protein TVY486_1110480 [Trypanosoma vivax Y486]
MSTLSTYILCLSYFALHLFSFFLSCEPFYSQLSYCFRFLCISATSAGLDSRLLLGPHVPTGYLIVSYKPDLCSFSFSHSLCAPVWHTSRKTNLVTNVIFMTLLLCRNLCQHTDIPFLFPFLSYLFSYKYGQIIKSPTMCTAFSVFTSAGG